MSDSVEWALERIACHSNEIRSYIRANTPTALKIENGQLEARNRVLAEINKMHESRIEFLELKVAQQALEIGKLLNEKENLVLEEKFYDDQRD
jgi:hypothetical protein